MSNRMRRRITTAKREEIEKEQKLLDTTIVRPFETLQGLPTSYSAPPGQYEDILKNPLTVKDSAVLYNSLLRSRNTFVHHAPMFKLHWVRQTAYAKKLAEMDKEKQKEVLEDRENKRRFAKATSNSLEAHFRQPVLTPEINARDVMSKLCESSITIGPHTMDIRIYIAKDARSDKSKRGEPLPPGPGDQTLCLNRAFASLSPIEGKPETRNDKSNEKAEEVTERDLNSTSTTEHDVKNETAEPDNGTDKPVPNSGESKNESNSDSHTGAQQNNKLVEDSSSLSLQSNVSSSQNTEGLEPRPTSDQKDVVPALETAKEDSIDVDVKSDLSPKDSANPTEASPSAAISSEHDKSTKEPTVSNEDQMGDSMDIVSEENVENPVVSERPVLSSLTEKADATPKSDAIDQNAEPVALEEAKDVEMEEADEKAESAVEVQKESNDMDVDLAEEKHEPSIAEIKKYEATKESSVEDNTAALPPSNDPSTPLQSIQEDLEKRKVVTEDEASKENEAATREFEEINKSEIEEDFEGNASPKASVNKANEETTKQQTPLKEEEERISEMAAGEEVAENEVADEGEKEEDEEEELGNDDDIFGSESEEEIKPKKYGKVKDDDYFERGLSGKGSGRKRGPKPKKEELVEPIRRLSRLKEEALKPPPPPPPPPAPVPPKPKGKRRGRPPLKPRPEPKIEEEEMIAPVAPKVEVKKRGRGRPRIHPIVEPPKKKDEQEEKQEIIIKEELEEPKQLEEHGDLKPEDAVDSETGPGPKLKATSKLKAKENSNLTPQSLPKEASTEPTNANISTPTTSAPAPTQGQTPGQAPAPPPPPPTNFQSIESYIMIENLNTIALTDLSLNDLMRDVALGTASEAEVERFKMYIEQAKRMGPQPHHAEIYYQRGLPLPPNFPRVYPPRPAFDPQMALRQRQLNALKLTAFQERYLYNATLVIEFHENANVRYIIPQDSICEVLEPEKPVPEDAEEGMEFKDILFSHIWIHNMDEVLKYEKELEEYDKEMEKYQKEKEARKKFIEENERRAAEGLPLLEEPVSGESRTLRVKKKTPGLKKKDDAPQLPDDPNLKYTTYSFTLHNIPTKYVPIVVNSVKPAAEIRARMEKVLRAGTRVASYYLWYRVDARLDEKIAESLRGAALEEEKDMPGLVPPVEPKKRKPQPSKNPKQKRVKEGTPDGKPVVLTNPMTAKGYTPVLNSGVTGPEHTFSPH